MAWHTRIAPLLIQILRSIQNTYLSPRDKEIECLEFTSRKRVKSYNTQCTFMRYKSISQRLHIHFEIQSINREKELPCVSISNTKDIEHLKKSVQFEQPVKNMAHTALCQ
jgi:hypothetical protein